MITPTFDLWRWAYATSAALGPSVAAGILSVASWQWLFAINVPLGVAGLVFARSALPRTPLARHRFDWLSALLSTATFGALIIGIDNLRQLTVTVVFELGGAAVAGGRGVWRPAHATTRQRGGLPHGGAGPRQGAGPPVRGGDPTQAAVERPDRQREQQAGKPQLDEDDRGTQQEHEPECEYADRDQDRLTDRDPRQRPPGPS